MVKVLQNSHIMEESLETPLLSNQNNDNECVETEVDNCDIPSGSREHLTDGAPTCQRPAARSSTPCFVYALTFFSAIGGFLFGYDTGVISGAMILLIEVFHLSPLWQELVVSVTIGAAALFSFIGGILNDRFGRKPTILMGSVIFTSGAILLGAAQNTSMLLIGRLIVGMGIGLASTTVPMYIAESAPLHLRGRLVTLNNLFITGGQCIAGITDGAFSYDKVDGWRYMLGLAALPSVIQFFGFIFMPESPRYLVAKDNDIKARSVLQKIRGTPDIEDELASIRHSIDEDRILNADAGNSPTIWRILTTPHVRKALFLGCALQLFQQISGINTVMYYSATIIKMSGVKDVSSVIWLAALTAGANFVFTLLGVYLVEKIGRKPLTLVSLTGTFLSLAVLAIGFQLAAVRSPAITTVESIPLNISNNFLCSNYSSCDSCMRDTHCGFCYKDVHSNISDGSCLPAYEDQFGTPYSNGSMYGRCSQSHLEGDLTWAYEYCPTNVAWMATFGLILYLACFAPGMGPMPWTINSEIYPMWARSTGNAVATTTNWISNLVISMTFLTLTENITRYGAFWLYSGFSLMGIIVLSIFLPETRGKSLEEVENLFKKPTCL